MNVLALFEPIRLFVFDIDGVLTNGQLLVREDGTLLRSMSIKDGYALQLAIKKGYEVFVISGGKSDAARIRLNRLGLEHVFIGIDDKAGFLRELMAKYAFRPEETLYMGDDMPDRKPMQACGLKVAPADAVPEILALADYISPKKGGEGCVRDVIEKVLKIQGNWE